MFVFELKPDPKSQHEYVHLRMELPGYLTWRELLEAFTNFLRACGYQVESADIMTPEAMMALEADWEADAACEETSAGPLYVP